MNSPAFYAPKVMLMGTSGSGKTHAIRTFLDAGIETFVVATEPGVSDVLGDTPTDKLHWHYISPMPMSWDVLGQQINQINTMTFEALTKMTADRTQFRQMLDVNNLIKNYKCQRTGKEYGDVATWDHTRALVFDSLSGLTLMGMNAWLGTKPVLSPADYNVIQTMLERYINSLCMNLRCFFVLTAHVEKEVDEVLGGINIMASTLGRKLAPKLPRFFSEVIYARREGAGTNTQFFWSTASAQVDTKKRILPFGDKLNPSFKELVDLWRKKNAVPTTPSNP